MHARRRLFRENKDHGPILKGPKATIQIGPDYEKTVQHPSRAAAKSNISIAFSYGTLSVKGLTVEARKGKETP